VSSWQPSRECLPPRVGAAFLREPLRHEVVVEHEDSLHILHGQTEPSAGFEEVSAAS
jgi:hypothetical protein